MNIDTKYPKLYFNNTEFNVKMSAKKRKLHRAEYRAI